MSLFLLRCTVLLLPLLLAAPLAAQRPDPSAWLAPIPRVGGPAVDRLRTMQILGRGPTDGFLLRSASQYGARPAPGGGGLRWQLLAPEAETVWNSRIPFSLNDGALWAGRGANTRFAAGARAMIGPFTLTLAPQLVHMANEPVRVLPGRREDRSDYSSPWHDGALSADLPLRFGSEPLTLIDPGQSSLVVELGGAAAGLSTESQWWGPGVRNAIVLSDNAPGIPHAFLATASPLSTPLGRVEARWIIGELMESLYFDRDPGNDSRSLSALALTLSPALEPDLTLGIARAVYAPARGTAGVAGHALDVLTYWGSPYRGATIDDTGADQLLSLFARWIFPRDGFEIYGEWARLELPSLRELLTTPHETQGYTLGLQWARPFSGERAVRLQGEITYLEQTPIPGRALTPSYYVSGTVPQGYTHRGRVVGAAIGPGASSQWLAADYLGAAWEVGLFGGRIRWENDAYYRQPTGISYHAHDVSLFGGVRAGGEILGAEVRGEAIVGKRHNFLFESLRGGYGAGSFYDVHNLTLRLSLAPAAATRKGGR